MFGFLMSLITAIRSKRAKYLQRKENRNRNRETWKSTINREDVEKVSDLGDTKGDRENQEKSLKSRVMASVFAVIGFFETLPLFLSIMFWSLVICCVIAVSIIVFSMLAALQASIDEDLYDFSDSIEEVVESDSEGGALEWTEEELSSRGVGLTDYEKNLYRMGIFARKAIEGYGGKELMTVDVEARDMAFVMLYGIASTETGMQFYKDGKNYDISKVPSDINTNSSGYGFFGLHSSDTLDKYFGQAVRDNITSQYTPDTSSFLHINYAPWSVAMGADHFQDKLDTYILRETTKAKVDAALDAWGITNNRDEVRAFVMYNLGVAQYHGAELVEHEDYINFYLAFYCATSDIDSERSLDKWEIQGDLSFSESNFRKLMLGTTKYADVDLLSTPNDFQADSGVSVALYLNGSKITEPLWKFLWGKFGDRSEMKASWARAQKVATSTGGVKDRVLNFHYGINSYMQGKRITSILQSKMIGTSNSGSSLGEQIATAGEKWIGIPYKQVNTDFSIITPGQYVNGKNIKGSFVGFLDCSRFTLTVYEEFGVELPRRAQWQFDDDDNLVTVTESFDTSKMEKGDLIFFWGTAGEGASVWGSYGNPTSAPMSVKGNYISHVGIYHGDGKMIHADATNGVLVTDVTSSYWKKYFASVKRLK